MVTSPDGGGVMVIGGYDRTIAKGTGKILELRASGSNIVDWKKLDPKLENGRTNHVVIQVPESITTCQ